MNEKEILFNAINNLAEESIIATWEGDTANSSDNGFDGEIMLQFRHHPPLKLPAEIKREIRNSHLSYLEERLHRNPNYLLIAERIAPSMKEKLKEKKVNFLEANGNIFLYLDNIYINIDGKKSLKSKTTTNRAYTKTGLATLFLFLTDESWINRPYRDIAHYTGTGLGNISNIFNGLKEDGFLIQLTKEEMKLENKKALLEKWIAEYEKRLKPSLAMGRFRFLKEDDFYDWRQVTLKSSKTYWGDEPAGALYTDYLRPEVLTLYTSEEWNDLIKNYRLVPDKNGNVEVYKKFWKVDQVNENVVHPLLAYTDLINKGDRRCTETAEIIYNEYLQDKF